MTTGLYMVMKTLGGLCKIINVRMYYFVTICFLAEFITLTYFAIRYFVAD
jgi:hypothetical protein